MSDEPHKIGDIDHAVDVDVQIRWFDGALGTLAAAAAEDPVNDLLGVDRPVSRSWTITALSTVPWAANAALRVSSVVLNDRLPT